MIFGGWQPYENLPEIDIYDTKKNCIEDILPLAHGIRGRPFSSKKEEASNQHQIISASTAQESNFSDYDDSQDDDEDDYVDGK